MIKRVRCCIYGLCLYASGTLSWQLVLYCVVEYIISNTSSFNQISKYKFQSYSELSQNFRDFPFRSMTYYLCHPQYLLQYYIFNINQMLLLKRFNIVSPFRNCLHSRIGSKFSKVIYMDYQATTPIDYRVLDAMTPYMMQYYGNPHSKTHQYGWESSKAVEVARQQISDLIGADPRQIIFTSGATESNNMVLKGLASFYGQEKKHIITTQFEHKCILDTCRNLQLQGFKVTYLPLQKSGLLDLDLLKKTIDESTEKVLCVSTIFVNNEIGVVQQVKQIGKICKDRNVFYHTDGAQAVGKLPINVNEMNIDLLSISGHKIYGPKGIGALYIRRKPRVRILPLINGGGQQRGLRSGTLAPALIVGLGKACEVAKKEMKNDQQHIQRLYWKVLNRIKEKIPFCQLNGDENHRYKGNLNFSFAYVEGESLLMALKRYAVSSGSACTSQSLEPSFVLRAIGVAEDLAHTSLRIGLGRFTLQSEVDEFLQQLEKSVQRLREMSPLYEMVKEGVDITSINWTQPH